MTPFSDASVADAFDAYPPAVQSKLFELRELIFETALSTPGVGMIEETLKWGEPAYLTPETKSGSTIRLGSNKSALTCSGMYFNCNTDLVESFRALFAGELKFEGNRAIVFDESEELPRDALSVCIEAALTYHQKKRKA